MIAYVIDFRKPSGISNSGGDDATMITAENATVRPDVITARRTAAGCRSLGELLPEPAHDEQAIVDGDTEAHHRDHGLGEEVHRGELGGESQDAQCATDGQAADDGRQCGRHDAAEHEEQHDGHQRDDGDLGALLVGADGSGELAGQRVQPGKFDIAAVDLLQVGFDRLVVLQGWCRRRRPLSGMLTNVCRRSSVFMLATAALSGALSQADPVDDLVRGDPDHLIQFAGDLRLPVLVGDLLIVRGVRMATMWLVRSRP